MTGINTARTVARRWTWRIRLYKDAYFVFVSGNKTAGCKLLVTVILYDPDWRDKRKASFQKGQEKVKQNGNDESNA